MIDKDEVTGVILAGGRGSRMGGVDKGLQNFRGMPMAMGTLMRLAPQVGEAMINANRNLSAYESFGVPVWPDSLADYAGPLGRLPHGAGALRDPLPGHRSLRHAAVPAGPGGAPRRGAGARGRRDRDGGGARGGRPVPRRSPCSRLLRRELMESLVRFTHEGGRKIDAWTAQHRTVLVPFDRAGDDPGAFFQRQHAGRTAPARTVAMNPSIAQIAARLQGYDPQALSADGVGDSSRSWSRRSPTDRDRGVLDALGRVLARTWSPRSACRRTTTPPWTATPSPAPAQPPPRAAAGSGGDRPRGQGLAGRGAGQCVKIMTGAVMPGGPGHRGAAGVHQGAARRPRRDPAGLLQPGDNRRLQGEDLRRAGRPARRRAHRPRRLRADRQPGHRAGVSGPEGGLLLHRRRDPEPGRAAARRRGVRQQPLHRARPAGRLGCEVIDLGVVRDDPALLEQAFRDAAARADAIITSGGVSVGEADFTKAMMKKLGDVAFWKIAMRPGRPMAVGRIGDAVLFGLPGNPVAVMVTFLAFVRPALLRMMGARVTEPVLLKARSAEAIRKKPGRTEYQRGTVTRSARGPAGSPHHRQPGLGRAQLHGPGQRPDRAAPPAGQRRHRRRGRRDDVRRPL